MFLLPAKCLMRRSITGLIRPLTVSSLQFHPRSARQTNVDVDKPLQDDFESIVEIESNLFDASSQMSKERKFSNNVRHLSKEPNLNRSDTKPKQRQPKFKKHEPVSSSTLHDTDLNLSYVKLSLHDPLLSKLMLTAKSRKAQARKSQIVIEGRRLILDAISAGAKLETILFAQKATLMEIKDAIRKCKNVQIVRAPQQDLRSWSTLVTCPGVIAIFQKPTEEEIKGAAEQRNTLPITVVCDNIREPNNLGSIIRSCAAIPCDEVLVTKGCCDPWDTKALRGGCGAQFHVAVHDDMTWDEIDHRLFSSPTDPHVRQSPLVYLAESNTKNSEAFGANVFPYDKMRISETTQNCVLVIGGETHGISADAYRLLNKSNGRLENGAGGCLHIPMASRVNSLNTASAITLLLFEMRRKFMEIREKAAPGNEF